MLYYLISYETIAKVTEKLVLVTRPNRQLSKEIPVTIRPF